jgi:alpha-galactosidase
MKLFFLLFIGTYLSINVPGSDTLVISNDIVSRKLFIDKEKNSLSTVEFRSLNPDYNFHRAPSPDFSFTVNEENVSGLSGHFRIDKISNEDDKLLNIHLVGTEGMPTENIILNLYYQIPDNTCGTRKWFSIENNGSKDILIENISIEDLNLDSWGGANSVIYANFGRYFYKPPYKGYQEDPALFIEGEKGTITLGNEAPGMTKYTEVFAESSNGIKIGMRPSSDPYAVNIRLKPGETFNSPRAFILFTPAGEDPTIKLKDFTRQNMNVVFLQRETYPAFFYNTWSPFRTEINEQLIREIADSLEGTGAGYLIIDDGWQNNYGDWEAHPEKFPSGMKHISDYIRSKGMKPGIWFSLCSVEKTSKAYEIHQQNAINNPEGKPTNLHGWANNLSFFTMDILSPWYDYIMEKTRKMIEDYGFEYFKIDLSFIKSAYITDPSISGSYREGEPESNHEFYYPAYQKLIQYFDELKADYPDVIFDCTYELWGDHHSIDYALIQHADVDWISNFFHDPPEGSRDVRFLAWHRGNVIPTPTMMIGNQQMDVPGHQFSFLSGFSGIPMMLGDPRKLILKEKAWYRKMSDWFLSMQEKYDFMPYYQTEGFNTPDEFNWDGFTRINPETGGGILCVFRNSSPDLAKNILVLAVDGGSEYRVLDVDGSELGVFSGEELRNEGIRIEIEERNSGRVFEVEKVE